MSGKSLKLVCFGALSSFRPKEVIVMSRVSDWDTQMAEWQNGRMAKHPHIHICNAARRSETHAQFGICGGLKVIKMFDGCQCAGCA